MGKEYSVVCSHGQERELIQAAGHLDERMRQIQKTGKMISIERCAIMAALNLAHELLNLQEKSEGTDNVIGQLRNLHGKIEAVMQEQKRLL